MKKIISLVLFFLAVFSFSSCSAIAEIFKAGVWVGVIIVIAVIALILFLVSRGSNKN